MNLNCILQPQIFWCPICRKSNRSQSHDFPFCYVDNKDFLKDLRACCHFSWGQVLRQHQSRFLNATKTVYVKHNDSFKIGRCKMSHRLLSWSPVAIFQENFLIIIDKLLLTERLSKGMGMSMGTQKHKGRERKKKSTLRSIWSSRKIQGHRLITKKSSQTFGMCAHSCNI